MKKLLNSKYFIFILNLIGISLIVYYSLDFFQHNILFGFLLSTINFLVYYFIYNSGLVNKSSWGGTVIFSYFLNSITFIFLFSLIKDSDHELFMMFYPKMIIYSQIIVFLYWKTENITNK